MSCEGLELWAGVNDVLQLDTASVQAVLVGIHFQPQPAGSLGIGLREQLLQPHGVKETQDLAQHVTLVTPQPASSLRIGPREKLLQQYSVKETQTLRLM